MADSSPKKETNMEKPDADLEEVNCHITEVYSILNNRALKLRKEMGAFETMAKKLEHVHFSKTLKLNVGGQQFSTSLDTMKKDAGSMFHAMFSGRFETTPDEDGAYFIDRDGTHFRYILNYLRTGCLLLPDNEFTRREVLKEAEFYQIEGIISKLVELLPDFENSTLELTLLQRRTLKGWLTGTKSEKLKATLIYRGSRDGWRAEDFHACCDNRGPTLVVARSNYNYLFGGYTEEQWDTSETCKEDLHAFLFNLSGLIGGPHKMDLRTGEEGSCIYCSGDHGPLFGNGRDWNLRINNNPHRTDSCTCCSDFEDDPYMCPQGELDYHSTMYLAGKSSFSITELEVYTFEK